MASSAASTEIPTYPDLAGRVAVVAGGSKGIGADTCRVLAANRVRVTVNGRDQAGIDALVTEIQSGGGEAVGVAADVCDAGAIERMREEVERRLGPVDILVAFAGGFGAFTPVQEIAEDEWRSIIDSNLTSTFLTVKVFLPGMIERRRGAIVTMSSNAGRYLDMNLTASYAAAKAGIVMFSRHVAREVGQHGVRVNCLAPATTLSERVERIMPPDRRDAVAAMAPLGRLGVPRDSALATLFLVSDAASWLTGVTIDVAGGRIML